MIRRPPRSTLFPYTNALPISPSATQLGQPENFSGTLAFLNNDIDVGVGTTPGAQTLGIVLFNVGRSPDRSEEHTSELQSQSNLVCRLLLEKKNGLFQELPALV